jgi:hypothetical protein
MSEPSAMGNKTARAKALPMPRWSWLSRVLAAWLVVMLAFCLGLLSFAAVREMSVECRREPSYLLSAQGNRIRLADGSGYLLLEEKRLRCRFAMGDYAVSFP